LFKFGVPVLFSPEAAMSKPDTRQRILDTAERLFAREGFPNTSLRSITADAGVNLAAVNYHFGSKEALLEAVLDRRLVPLNALRRERLEAVRDTARKRGQRPAAVEVLRAFMEPTLRFGASEPGTGEFIALAGRAISETDDTVRRLFTRHTEPIFLLLREILGEALPDLPQEVLIMRLHFFLGAMSHTIFMTAGPRSLASGLAPAADAGSLAAQLLDFAAAGMEAP
jgi:AcrR family transcriptional regulator